MLCPEIFEPRLVEYWNLGGAPPNNQGWGGEGRNWGLPVSSLGKQGTSCCRWVEAGEADGAPGTNYMAESPFASPGLGVADEGNTACA